MEWNFLIMQEVIDMRMNVAGINRR